LGLGNHISEPEASTPGLLARRFRNLPLCSFVDAIPWMVISAFRDGDRDNSDRAASRQSSKAHAGKNWEIWENWAVGI
jgi:hypothetical protein